MEWSKVKNIILLMLVLTNILILFFVVFPQAQTVQNTDEMRLSALSMLEKQGLSVSLSLGPQEITLQAQQVIPDRSQEVVLAQNLLGTVSMLDLGGEVYRYEGSSGSIRFHSGGELSAQLSLEGQSPQAHGETILSTLELSATLLSIVEDGAATSLTYGQLWDGVPLLDYGLTLNYQENTLVSISDGRRLYGTASDLDQPTISVATALMQFLVGIQSLGDICRTVTAITPAYDGSTDLSGAVQLIPIWCMDTDTGSYHLNLLTGALTRV